MLKEFKAVVGKGNFIDFAVAIIIGTAFGCIPSRRANPWSLSLHSLVSERILLVHGVSDRHNRSQV
jgi:hypothetical protein